MGWFKDMIKSWLEIEPAQGQRIVLRELMSWETCALKNKLWYRGDADELEQFYKKLNADAGKTRFWAAAPVTEQIRKMHSGLPALMVDTLAYMVKSDINAVEIEEDDGEARWEEIESHIGFTQLVGDAVTGALSVGDGAFKISVDTDAASFPLVEFVSGERVEFERRHGMITAICFITYFNQDKKRYRLRERYATGTVDYELTEGDKPVPLNTLPELAHLRPVRFSGDYMMAVPLIVYRNPKFQGRGRSIYDTKTDVFDAHDEVISQWMDAIRAGRVQKYIPDNLIPRNPADGSLMPVNTFGTNFVQITRSAAENATSEIITIQPEIRYDAFLASYSATLNMCLQGILSPATLGIDVGKMSSGEAQREKKDVTGATRNAITDALEQVLPELIRAVLMTEDNMRGEKPGEYNASVTFGEYGAPDFDSRVETVGKGSTTGIMSIESQVEELWGASKDDEWKEEEVKRIKLERGLVEEPEPSVGDEV